MNELLYFEIPAQGHWFILNCSWLVNTSLKMKNNMVGVRIKELLVIDEELQI